MHCLDFAVGKYLRTFQSHVKPDSLLAERVP